MHGGCYSAIRGLGKPLHRKDRVVGLDDDVADVLSVWKDRKGGYQFFGKAILELLQEE